MILYPVSNIYFFNLCKNTRSKWGILETSTFHGLDHVRPKATFALNSCEKMNTFFLQFTLELEGLLKM